MNEEKWCLHAALADLRPYNARTITAVLPSYSLPKMSGPNVTCTRSRGGALRKALPMSALNMFKSFRDASKKANLTLSLDATLEYVA